MRFVFFDNETHLIKPGCSAPRVVCVSAVVDYESPLLFLRDDGLQFVYDQLRDKDVILGGQNVFYDLGTICAEDPGLFVPLVFQAFHDFRIRDTIVRQQLIDIASGDLKYRYDERAGEYVKTGYTLQDLCLRLLGRHLPKEDTWRLKYALLDGVPLSDWPEEAKKYAIDDSLTARDCFWEQARAVSVAENERPEDPVAAVDEARFKIGGVVPTEARATREAWALWLMSTWGVRTDGEATAKLKVDLQAEQAEAMVKLANTGIVVRKKNGAWGRKMKEIYKRVKAGFEGQGKDVPLTAKNKVSTEYEALVECGDADLKVLADASGGAKLLNTYIPILEHGQKYPINARFNVLVESNRTSCSKPNMQNPPRKGGIRECYVARPGYVYCSVDYDTIELRSLAQSCLDLVGFSSMAEALRNGEDLHLNLAADFMGITREEAAARLAAGDEEVAEQRQLMKPANFGFPGGMASDSFVDYVKGYDIVIDRDLAKQIHLQWKRVWPEMEHYFNYVSRIVGSHGEGKVSSPRSGFVRGGLRFTQLSNHYFQSLTATGAKDALWHVTNECYNVPSSPLYGCRPVVFMHDEVITEMPEERASDAALRQAVLMIEVMQRWIPDIPIKAGPVLMRRWYKGTKAVRVDGKLVPSRPVKKDGKTIWEADV